MQLFDLLDQLDDPYTFGKNWNNGYHIKVIKLNHPDNLVDVDILYQNTNVNFSGTFRKQFAQLGVSFELEAYRGVISYYLVPQDVVVRFILAMDNISQSNNTAFKVAEYKCKRCSRDNDYTAAECWWCGLKDPVK